MGTDALIIWRLLDGRRGHLTQIAGLSQALAERTPVEPVDIEARGGAGYIGHWLSGRFPPGDTLPSPDLILAAGHATHVAGLAARRAHGGRLVVLMRPSLPLSWFDLCLVPEHDRPPARANVIATRGAITTVRPSGEHDPDRGLILLGGPSRHHDWDSAAIVDQVRAITASQPAIRFAIGDSPRTPGDIRQQLAGRGDCDFIPWEQTRPGEIQALMQSAGQVWVSEDSVSMLYESLSSGAPTGLLGVPRRRETRISRGVERLIEGGLVTPYAQGRDTQQLATPPMLDEAGRCADEILRRWPTGN